ncbi:MAG: bifunctional 4-hydroxy-3-methylbut-2-enyl diphosphate reductase/30S ribosomal protein S1 [Oscillospiraceae bacterium]|nr:bifunctional 4-hydroxy-3-methylbut-2-enyl diphosphate reductase/30S ribosomal protein S1 [Oscillospiraceae bacterium]
MKITKAKTAGFCFGVNRAVDMTTNLAKEGKKVATMGPLIHNKQAVAALEELGVITLDSLEAPEGYEVVLRSHGVEKPVYDYYESRGIVTHDATCPYVKKIHRLAEKTGKDGRVLLVAGDKNHAEVKGIVSYTDGEYFVFNEPEELSAWLSIGQNAEKSANLVAQTTYMLKKWDEIVDIVKKVCTDCEIFDTICRATNERQTEAALLSQQNDLMVVIGGRHSSNTQKLVKVCQEYCKTISIETVKELSPELFINIQNVGVTAGASTPAFIIQEVLNNMSEVIREDGMSFEEMLNESYANQPKVYRGAKIKGVVTGVSANEVTVDIGTKHTGFIKASELSDDPSAKVEDLVKKGDELNLIVIKPNDAEGTVELSKKRYDAQEGADAVAKAAETGEVLVANIVEAVKGGLVAFVNGVRVFIPASLAAGRNESLEALVKTKQEIKIIESSKDGNRRKVIGSIRAVKEEKSNELKEKFWVDVEEGKVYNGVVKSLTRYGAFVDLGGVDGLVHMSELTWEKIKHPAEILKVGQEIEVFVKSLDRENGKISLGHKKEEDNPWAKFETEYPIGTVMAGTVASLTKFGAFVKILPGVDGLVHISEISYERVEDPAAVLKVGQEVQVKLIGVDLEAKRVSLSIKQTMEPPVKEEKAEDAE